MNGTSTEKFTCGHCNKVKERAKLQAVTTGGKQWCRTCTGNVRVISKGMKSVFLAAVLNISEENATKIIRLADAWRYSGTWFSVILPILKEIPDYERETYRFEKIDRLLWGIDKILETNGVEILCTGGEVSPQQMDGSDIVLSYCNAGDTYSVTVAYEHLTDKFILTSWGDWHEAHPALMG